MKLLIDSAELHVQAVSRDAEGMVREAKKIVGKLGEHTFVKIPSVPEGFKAMKLITGQGIHVTATAVYTPTQAFLAAKAGAIRRHLDELYAQCPYRVPRAQVVACEFHNDANLIGALQCFLADNFCIKQAS